MYACYTDPRQNNHRYYRQLSWKAAAWGSKFVTLYQFHDWPNEVSFRQTTFGGITYQTPDDLVPSVRFYSMEAGMNDIRYLKCLEKLAARCQNEDLAKEATDFIVRAYDDVTRTSQHDPTSTDRFRVRCAELIGRIKGK